TPTHVEVSGSRAEPVLRDEGRVTNLSDELRVTMRGPASAVLGTEGATAGPEGDLGSIAWPLDHVPNVSTVALAFNAHDCSLHDGWRLTRRLSRRGPA